MAVPVAQRQGASGAIPGPAGRAHFGGIRTDRNSHWRSVTFWDSETRAHYGPVHNEPTRGAQKDDRPRGVNTRAARSRGGIAASVATGFRRGEAPVSRGL
jgi:hypothetical protein